MSNSNSNNKYKNILLNGVQIQESKASSNLDSLDKFLESEKTANSAEPWSKLDKTIKIKKLLAYAETYKVNKNLDENDYNILVTYLKDCLDRKKLLKVKEVIYDKETGLIKDIPGLTHNKTSNSNNFTLRSVDKRVSTLKSLAPKKVKTAKNKVDNDSSDEEEDN
jgi:hypothetical protein